MLFFCPISFKSMQIYFLASIQKLEENFTIYKKIIDESEKAGHLVLYDHILNRNPKFKDSFNLIKSDREYYIQMRDNIRLSDAVFCVLDGATVNVGYEICLALSTNIPVAIFCDKNLTLSPIINGNDSQLLYVFRHEGVDSVASCVESAIASVSLRSITGIVLPIGKLESDYLSWISATGIKSKTLFIRNLISAALLKDKKYKKFKGLKT